MVAEMQKQTVLTRQSFSLDPYVKCERAQEFEEKLSARIVGQENAHRLESAVWGCGVGG